jgi:hypothetical protein
VALALALEETPVEVVVAVAVAVAPSLVDVDVTLPFPLYELLFVWPFAVAEVCPPASAIVTEPRLAKVKARTRIRSNFVTVSSLR